MTQNTFGTLFKFTSFGESHGPAIGCIVDGVPSMIELSEADIQPYLDARRPAQSRHTTQRKESDRVQILSGVFEGKTTGAPIGLIIHNEDQKSKDYDDIKDKFRPGHADYTYHKKYGIRDYRGGGRSSARETAMRVAAGAIARKILSTLSLRERGGVSLGEGSPPLGSLPKGEGIFIGGCMIQMGEHKINRDNWDCKAIKSNPFWCPDPVAAAAWETQLDAIRKSGSSVGAVIEVVAKNVPAGLGAPVYSKLDADLAAAMMSINAVKGVEIGDGFAAAALRGEENADRMRAKKPSPSGRGLGEGKEENNLNVSPHPNPDCSLAPSPEGEGIQFLSNHAGGILGGISTGQPIVARFAVKPTSSILQAVETVDIHGQNTTIQTKGRHDPCVGIRAVPVGEAMMACVLADHLLMHKAIS